MVAVILYKVFDTVSTNAKALFFKDMELLFKPMFNDNSRGKVKGSPRVEDL